MQQTIPKMVFERIEHFAQQAVMRQKINGSYQAISWQQFGSRINDYAAALLALGLKPEQQVAILSPNCPEWACADLAIMSIGGRTVPIYHTEGIKTILHILADSQCQFLFTHSLLLAEDILSHQQRCPQLQKIILLEGRSKRTDILSLNSFLALGQPEFLARVEGLRTQGHPQELATLVYTSGTTGKPKGAMLTHSNILSNVDACCERFQVGPQDQCLSFLPLSHIFERTTGYYLMLHQGATIAYAESIDTVATNLTEIKPTVIISVPRLYEKMYNRVLERVTTGPWLTKQLFFFALMIGKAKVTRNQRGLPATPMQRTLLKFFDKLIFSKIKARFGGKLRILISGGAPLSEEIAEFFLAADVPIYQGYGLTETAPVISVNYAGKNRLASVGQPLSSLQLQLAADGELLVKGTSVFKGYWKQPKETAETLQDGWFQTGDLAELDAEGFLYITGRKKDIIVTAGGKNVAPQQIENELKADKFISNVMVYGDKKPFLIALIVPDFANLQKYANYKHLDFLDQSGLIKDAHTLDLIRRRIIRIQSSFPTYQQIKRFTLLARDFSSEKGEVTQTLKVKRNVVGKRFAQVIEDLYSSDPETIHKTGFCSINSETELEKP